MTSNDGFWFPGRWVGGVALILAPLVLVAGMALRLPFHFFFPEQLAAFETHPVRIKAAYSLVVAGNILLWPAIVTLATRIGATRPRWAVWGGTLVLLGLFARTFHAGIDHLAFELVRVQSVEVATRAVADSYGAFHVVKALSAAIMSGWVVLAIGAYRAGVLGPVRAVALGLMAGLMLGVLKGSSLMSLVATGGLAVALVPLGVTVLGEGPRPRATAVIGWTALIVALGCGFVWLGQQG